MVGGNGGTERRGGLAANLAAGALGLLLLLLAARMGEGWAHRHFLPAWAYGWQTQMRILLGLRLAIAAAGLAVLLLLRPWLVRAARAGRGRQALVALASCALAVVAATGVAEAVLRTRAWQSTQERWDLQEPLRIRDPLYGWAFAPNHQGQVRLNGRIVHYATGPFGYRAPSAGAAPDLHRPTIVFAGESIVFGYGLDWRETLPAQVQALTGVQTANIAVNAHSTDQTLLRLRRELPRFEHPVAVIVPFMPRLFDRNLDRDRPHLDPALRWHSGEAPSFRLVELARRVLRYRSGETIEQGIAMTQAALRSAMALAEARGAQPILLVPRFEPEDAGERSVREAVLDRARIPYLLVSLPGDWRNPADGHPNPRGARALAEAVAAALSAACPSPGPPPARNCGSR